MNNRENTAYTLLFAIGLAGWVFCAYLAAKVAMPPKRAAKPTLIAVICEGCGTTWESYDGHRERIQKCPNCPMSDEEFEALKDAVRKRNDNDASR